MKTRLSILLSVAVVLAVILVAYYILAFNKLSPNPSPSPSPTHTPFPTHIPSKIDITLSQYSVNVTQGESFDINVTVTSLVENETITKTVGVQILGYNNSAWSGESQRIFNASFTVSPVVVGPREEKATILTMNIADDAPAGSYVFAVGNVQLVVVVNLKLT